MEPPLEHPAGFDPGASFLWPAREAKDEWRTDQTPATQRATQATPSGPSNSWGARRGRHFRVRRRNAVAHANRAPRRSLAARFFDSSSVWEDSAVGPGDLEPSLKSHDAAGRWGEASALGVWAASLGTHPTVSIGICRPEGSTPWGRPTQASGPRLSVVVMSRRTSLWVGPTLFGQSPEAAGGCSVQRPHCSGPGAPRSVAQQRSMCSTPPTDTPGSSRMRRRRRPTSSSRAGGRRGP